MSTKKRARNAIYFKKNIAILILSILFMITAILSIIFFNKYKYYKNKELIVITEVQTQTEYIYETIYKNIVSVEEVLVEIQPDIYNYMNEHIEFADDIIWIARTVQGEAGGLSLTERAAVIWCILNSKDKTPNKTIDEIILKGYSGYHSYNELTAENVWLTIDVLRRWEREKNGEINVGRVLPKEYTQFRGGKKYHKDYFYDLAEQYSLKGKYHNWFFKNDAEGYLEKDIYKRKYWDWSLESPYEE